MPNILQKLTQIRAQKEELEAAELALMHQIIEVAGHKKLGQSTYSMDGQKVTIKTGENVTLDKALLNTVWDEWMPINRSYSYTPRTKDLEAIMAHGSPEHRKLLATIVTTKPSKPVVKVGE